MRIFTFKFFFSILFTAFALSSSAETKTYSGANMGDWNVENNWSPSGIPTSSDAVFIPNGKTVILNVAVANCSYLTIETGGTVSGLNFSGSNTLNVSGNIDIGDGDPNTLAINGGTLNVGGNILIQGNGNKTGKLTVTTGLVNVIGNFGFVAIGNGNDDNKIVDVTGTGSIVVGGQFTNPSSGTITPQSVDNIFIRASYYKSASSGDWSSISTWLISKDNGTYYPSPLSPNASALGIEIVNSHVVTLSGNSPAASLVVNGTLDCGNFIINGPGPFTLNGNATLIVSNVNGISPTGGSTGAIQITGAKTYSSSANYTFKGTQAQETGTGLPTVLNGILTADNSASVTLTQNTLLTKLLQVDKGTFISNQASKGILTLESRATSYANVGPLLNGARVTGHVNVQSFFTGGSGKRGSRMISSPVIDDAIPTVYQQLKEKMVVTGPGGPANGFDFGGGNPNAVTLSTYYEPANQISSFVSVPNLNDITRATIGKAVFVFFRGDRNNAIGSKVNIPYATPEDVFGNYKGTINQGDVSIVITHSNLVGDTNNGINAVGNPYPATIDWDKVYATNSSLVDNVIRIVKPGGGMVTRKMVGSTPQTINTDQLGSQYIQPGQGFYIQKSSAGTADFKFFESHKAVNNSGGRILTLPSSERMATQPAQGQLIKDIHNKEKLLRINIQQNDLKDETLIVFEKSFSAAFDRNDAIYFAGNTVLVGSMSTDNKVTSINAMPDVKDVEELKLYVSASASGAAKLNFTDLSAGEGYQIFLKDALFPEKLIDLKLQSTYDFNIDRANVSSYGTSRFSIIFKPELVEAPIVFTAQKVKSNVELSWTTVVAPKVKYFEVEVSEDKIDFQNIGQVVNAGIETSVKFSFVDKSPAAKVRFYRLKQFNVNGSFTYSEPQMIDLSSTAIAGITTVSVYPNPTIDWIQVEFSQFPQSEVQATIFNIQGTKVKNMSFAANRNIRLEVGQFPNGFYLLELRDPATRKLIGHSKFIIGQ